MPPVNKKPDPFLGLELEGYVVEQKCGAGKIGAVYYAKRKGNIPDERAIKFISSKSRRNGWENEISKVTKLQLTEGVVPYVTNGEITHAGERYTWIAWKYVKGKSLKDFVETRKISIPLLCDVVVRILSVLHACSKVDVQHGDLHSGNILIEDPNDLNINPEEQRIWVTDFGYLTGSMGKDMLDDYQGLVGIINECLKVVDFHCLEGHDKMLFSALKRECLRDFHETDATQGDFVRNPRKLLERFQALRTQRDQPERQEVKRIGDYLAAEHIGDRYPEWKSLFVPSFIGSDQLLGRNICVLTGLRGCGKTMLFRRMTALFDFHLGPSGVPGADTFTGFYLNARSLAEAFPWLPVDKESDARDQVINYFHVSWILEILEWLTCIYQNQGAKAPPVWLTAFFKNFYYDELVVTESSELIIRHLKSFFAQELEHCRLKSAYRAKEWRLTRLDFLDLFLKEIEENVAPTKGKPFFFFLDDYSTPLVTEATQRILNSIVFRRSARSIFKISTESIESIELGGLHNKALEQEDDFVLIDSGTETIQRSKAINRTTIGKILLPRIERDARLAGRKLSLADILGPTPYNNIQLAEHLRSEDEKKNVKYHGEQVFCDLWSSNVREIISLFAEMIATETPERLITPRDGEPLISVSLQNKNFRNAGSRYRTLLVAATDPTKKLFEVPASDRSYGEHLQKIADAFHEIAGFELQHKTSKNVEKVRPKQARRIEIADVSKDLPNDLIPYYRGMIRYGLFIRDWRGKSARGKAVPRLYVRSILIPFYTLTFSKRDAITMEWSEFCEFLRNPKEFATNWPRLKPPKPGIQPITTEPINQNELPGLKK